MLNNDNFGIGFGGAGIFIGYRESILLPPFGTDYWGAVRTSKDSIFPLSRIAALLQALGLLLVAGLMACMDAAFAERLTWMVNSPFHKRLAPSSGSQFISHRFATALVQLD